MFAHFLTVILRHLLSAPTPHQVTDMAADALLPMILAESATFVSAGQALLGSQASEDARAAIAAHLHRLTEGLEHGATLDRSALIAFRKKLHTFVGDTRGIVHVR